ncbi:MAG: hypothetical protein II485_00120 [Firmicutes bacterium]|nr:hypothetical protein [Bacillota bacterium]
MAKKNEKGRYDNGPCPFCGRAIISLDHITKLSDGTEVCRDCVSKIRVMYPLVYGKKKGKKKTERLDPIEKLSREEFRAAMEKAPEYLEDLRAKYGRNAVYAVEDIKMIPRGWFRPPYICTTGRVIFGYFDIGDEVEVVRRGFSAKAKIHDIERENAGEKRSDAWIRRGEGGYPLKWMVFSQKDLLIGPGDLIVKG